MLIFDHMSLDDMDARDWRINTAGYLIANPRVARTGIQIYTGDEVGKPDQDRVRVFRPEEEVFDEDSLASFPYRPITNNHPPKFVDANNWKDFSVGGIGGQVARDEEGKIKFLRLPMMVMDGKTVNDMKRGKKQFSVGYDCVLDWTPGKDPASGEAYDCVQRKIRVNHVAVVDVARGGPDLAIDRDIDEPEDDFNGGDDDMANDSNARVVGASHLFMPMLVDSLQIQVPDAQTQSIITKALKDRDDALAAKDTALKAAQDAQAKAEAKLTTDAAAAKTELDKVTAERDAFKKTAEDNKITPAKLQAEAKKYADGISIAKQVVPNLVTDNKDLATIQKEVVLAKMGDGAKDYTEAQFDAAFNALTAGMKPTDAKPGPGATFRPGNSAQDIARAITGGGPANPSNMTDADQAYEEQNWITQNSYKGNDWVKANNPYARARGAAH